MKNTKLSIIVPVYNVQNRLPKCIDSLQSQTYSNIEIILINDGSTDDSLGVCRQYEKKDPRIILINQESHGVSFTRNTGLDNVKGEFIMFVDSDDFVTPTFCEDAINNLKKFNSDIAIFGFRRIEKGKAVDHLPYGESDRELDKETAIEKSMIDGYTWNKIYRRELFDGIRYPVNKNYEDLSTTYKILNKSKTISYCAKVNYYYVASNNSIVSDMGRQNIADQFDAAWQYMDFLKGNYPTAYQNNMANLLEYAIRYCTYCPKNYNPDYYDRAFNLLKRKPVMEGLDKSHRIVMRMFKISAPLTIMILSIRRKSIK